ncbi:uncharacterized protein VTP21DRAFT_6326 [Calcarisporiella thermophila]|uniref:uncharacterized protein n=1 Tax=Calcarisporiella thermophila TaxID=911321 RepID=UPI00374249BC
MNDANIGTSIDAHQNSTSQNLDDDQALSSIASQNYYKKNTGANINLSRFENNSPRISPERKQSENMAARASFVEFSANIEDHSIITKSPIIFNGFETASGKSLPPPSSESLKRARALLEEVDKENKENEKYMIAEPNDNIKSLHNEFINNKGTYNSILEYSDKISGGFGGFKTASGRTLAKPSEESMKKAHALFEKGEHISDRASERLSGNRCGGFATASGLALPTLSDEALERAKAAYFSEDININSGPGQIDFAIPITPKKRLFSENTEITQEIQEDGNQPFSKLVGSSEKGFSSPSFPIRGSTSIVSLTPPPKINATSLLQMHPSSLQREIPSSALKTPPPRSPKPIGISRPSSGLKRIRSQALKSPASRPAPFKTPWKDKNHPSFNVGDLTMTPTRKGPGLSFDKNNSIGRIMFDIRVKGTRKSLGKWINDDEPYSVKEIGSEIPPEILKLNPESAIHHRFIPPAGLDLSRHDSWGPNEAYEELLAAGAKPLDTRWVENHYRWIVWKLASMIRLFPTRFQIKEWWCPTKVLEQLKYRYEREINMAQRSALHRIIERDDSPSRYLVLCICGVFKENTCKGENTAETVYGLELTDGWYKIRASIDPPLTRALLRSKIKIGYKLAIIGAKLIGWDEAVPVLDVPENLRLRLTANSTRIARWDIRLGYQPSPIFYVSIDNLSYDGGAIAALDVVITRKYPIVYVENLGEGRRIVRIKREEDQASRRHQQIYENIADKIWSDVINEDENPIKISDITDQIAQYEYVEGRQRDEKRADLQAEFDSRIKDKKILRNVTPLLKLRVCDYPRKDQHPSREAILSIWGPSEELVEQLAEGNRYRIYCLNTSSFRHFSTSRSDPIRLTANRSTRWELMPICEDRMARSLYLPREALSFDELNYVQRYSEVDMAGIVLYITTPEKHFVRDRIYSSQSMFLGDHTGNIVHVHFEKMDGWNLKELCQEDDIIFLSNIIYLTYDLQHGLHNVRASESSEIKQGHSFCLPYGTHAMHRIEEWVREHMSMVEEMQLRAKAIVTPKNVF